MTSVAQLIELLKKYNQDLPVAVPLLGYDVDGYELLSGLATVTKVSKRGERCNDFEERHVGMTFRYAEEPDVDVPMWDAHLDVLVIE